MGKKIKLNIKFKGNEVLCAKSPLNCNECKDKKTCEEVVLYYNPYPKADIEKCFRNDERNR